MSDEMFNIYENFCLVQRMLALDCLTVWSLWSSSANQSCSLGKLSIYSSVNVNDAVRICCCFDFWSSTFQQVPQNSWQSSSADFRVSVQGNSKLNASEAVKSINPLQDEWIVKFNSEVLVPVAEFAWFPIAKICEVWLATSLWKHVLISLGVI